MFELGALPSLPFALGVATSLFSVLNPVSASVVFAGATAHMDAEGRRLCARRTSIAAVSCMLAFAILGQAIFMFFGFTTLAMRFVGGVLILYRSISMLYGDDPRERATEQEKAETLQKMDISIIPFGIPLLAGPGTISTVMGMIADGGFWNLLLVIGGILLNGWITFAILSHAPRVLTRLGHNGSKIVAKLMGLILAAVAMQFLINGVKGLVQEIRNMPQPAITAKT